MESAYLHGQELTARLVAGDRVAFEALYHQYAPRIYSHALRFTKSSARAKDITQEVFMKLWTSRHTLAEVERLDSFIFVVARNTIFSDLKKRLPVNASAGYFEQYDTITGQSPHEITEARELETHLHQAINRLPEQMQRAFKLSRFDGLTHDQIASRMQISAATSKSYIVRSLQSIRQYLEEQGISLVLTIMLLGNPEDFLDKIF